MPTVPLAERLKHRPAVHQLCSGVYLQEHVWLADDLLVVPLRPIGHDLEAHYIAWYTSEVAGAQVDNTGLQTLRSQGEHAGPAVAICKLLKIDAQVEDLEALAERDFPMARRLVGWIASSDAKPFGQLTLTSRSSFFKLITKAQTNHTRLGPGNTGVIFQSQVSQVFYIAGQDEHFSFALSLYDDALREANHQFKAARFFNCLECFAASLKSDAIRSRKAVKLLLGLDDASRTEAVFGNVRHRFDPIEIGGRIRDKLFHGAQYRQEDLKADIGNVYDLITTNPEVLAECLQMYCELEIARWANGTSKGLRT
jgi:hypothetical protein